MSSSKSRNHLPFWFSSPWRQRFSSPGTLMLEPWVLEGFLVAREERLRRDLQESPKSGSPQANAKYGWLGRKRLHPKGTLKTINYEIHCLHTFLHWAIRQNYLFSNPATSVERFRVSKKSLPRFMTSEDLRKFFQICDDEQGRIFSTMLLTGMRKGELENLTWNDVHFELAIIFIQPKEGWNPKSDDRIIPISPVLHQILSEQRERRSSEHWALRTNTGTGLLICSTS
jgi:integrase